MDAPPSLLPVPPVASSFAPSFAEWTVAALLLAFGLSYFVRARRAFGPAPATDAVFAAAWLCAAIAVLLPAVFRAPSHAAIESTGLPALLAEADQRIETAERLPISIWEALRERFGGPFDRDPPVDAIPLRGDLSLTERLEPAIVSLVARWMRISALAGAWGVMTAAFLWRRSVSGRAALRALEARVTELEARQEAAAGPSRELRSGDGAAS